MRVVNKLYREWSSTMRKHLRNLSLRSEGDLCKMLATKKCDTFVVMEGNLIIGWGAYALEPWYHQDLTGDFMLYVRKSHRRKGIARELIKAAVSKYGNIRIHPWNVDSGHFFSKMVSEMKNVEVARGSDWIEYVK